MGILSLLIWLPIMGMAAIAIIPREYEKHIKITAAITTGIQLLLSLILWQRFDSGIGTMQFMERLDWIPSFNISTNNKYICRQHLFQLVLIVIINIIENHILKEIHLLKPS